MVGRKCRIRTRDGDRRHPDPSDGPSPSCAPSRPSGPVHRGRDSEPWLPSPQLPSHTRRQKRRHPNLCQTRTSHLPRPRLKPALLPCLAANSISQCYRPWPGQSPRRWEHVPGAVHHNQCPLRQPLARTMEGEACVALSAAPIQVGLSWEEDGVAKGGSDVIRRQKGESGAHRR